MTLDADLPTIERRLLDDQAARTPDAELDPSELKDQPEEVERNQQLAECEDRAE